MVRGLGLLFWIKDALGKSALVHLSRSTRVWCDSLAQEADCKDALSGLRATQLLHMLVGSLCLTLGSLIVEKHLCAASALPSLQRSGGW